MSRTRFIKHNGIQILFLDFSRLSGTPEIAEQVEIARKIIAVQPLSSVRTLVDLTDLAFNQEAVQLVKEFTAHNKPYVIASALVGITGLKGVIVSAVARFSERTFKTFADLELAKQWLSEQ